VEVKVINMEEAISVQDESYLIESKIITSMKSLYDVIKNHSEEEVSIIEL